MPKRFNVVEAKVQSVRSFDNGRKDGATGSAYDLIYGYLQRSEILPLWGTRERLYKLREYYFHPRNTMVQGAFANLSKKQSSAPWEVSGPANAAYWQDILANAHDGAGWDIFVQLLQLNFLRYDTGAFIEIIGPGPVDGPLWGTVSGVAALDPLRCWTTNDPVYPVVYYDDDGGKHLMHHTRVHQIVDAPDGSFYRPGWGTCALSRAIAIAMREILMDRYINMAVDDKPTPGIMTVSGMIDKQFDNAKAAYLQQLRSDDMDVFGQTMFLFGVDVELTPQVNSVSFSTAPEKFDWVKYVELDAKLLALAIGVDPQDILPLSSGNLGTGTQTEILAAQARGKTEGDFRTKLSRAINWKVLPDPYKFEITYQDDQSDLTRAQIAATHAQTIQTVSASMSVDEVRRYLAAVDDTFRDILSNPDGTVRNLTDVDPVVDEQVADSETVQESETIIEEETPVLISTGAIRSAFKEWNQTREQFTSSLSRTLALPTTGVRELATLKRRLRQALRRWGQMAFEDGLVEGGVDTTEITTADMDTVFAWLQDQEKYIQQVGDEIYPGKLSPAQASMKAELWANKSLREIYQLGQIQADKAGMRKWALGQTERHCMTCLGLNGQVHRLETWQRAGLLPGVEKLECKGYNCDCRLNKTTDKARGSLTAYKWYQAA